MDRLIWQLWRRLGEHQRSGLNHFDSGLVTCWERCKRACLESDLAFIFLFFFFALCLPSGRNSSTRAWAATAAHMLLFAHCARLAVTFIWQVRTDSSGAGGCIFFCLNHFFSLLPRLVFCHRVCSVHIFLSVQFVGSLYARRIPEQTAVAEPGCQ